MSNLSHRTRTRLPLAAALALAATLAFSALLAQAAFAAEEPGLTDPRVTLSRTSGGAPSRFTFIADTQVPVSRLALVFPEGFDISKTTVDVVTLEGLKRTSVDVKADRSGQRVIMDFEPDVAEDSNVRVQVFDVVLPNEGGKHSLVAEYESSAGDGSIRTNTFTFDSATRAERVSRWLDRQSWVKTWNKVEFFRLFIRPQQIALAVPLLFKGWLMSISLVGVAFPIAIAGGLVLAFMKMSRIPPLRWIAALYINVIRGTPLFLQIYIAFVGLPIAGFRAPLFITGIVVLALNSSAYLAEIFRAGIQSIHKGQLEASSSLGMSYAQSMAYVIIPQTVKRVLPTMTSEFILLFKDTALLSAVGVFELILYSNSLANRSGNLTPYMVAAVYYLLVTIPLINWVGRLEARLAVAEGGQGGAQGPKGTKRGLFNSLARSVTPYRAAAPEGIGPSSEDRG